VAHLLSICGLSAAGTQPADASYRRTAQRWAVRKMCTWF